MNKSSNKDREILMERTFNAPRQLVWKAWSDPEHMKHWWGPDGFTNTIEEMDFRPGGICRFIMHGPDGTDYQNLIRYREVLPPEKLVYDHSDPGGEIQFEVYVHFEEVEEGTKLTMRSVFKSKEAMDFVIEKHGALEGAKQHLGRLAAYLEKMN